MNVWRARLTRWFSPAAEACPLSPNAITVIALLLNMVAAGCLYAAGRRPILFLLGVLVLAVAGLADAFDGIVARVQEKQTRFGDFLDHFCDRVSDTLLAASWMLGSGVRPALTIAALVTVGLNGYIGTQIEATWNQREYETVGRGEFVLALVVFPIVSYILATNGWHTSAWAGMTIAEWLAIAMLAVALLGIAQRLGVARRMDRQQ